MQMGRKRIPAGDLEALLHAQSVIETAQTEALRYRREVVEETERAKEAAEGVGFEQGMEQWSAQVRLLEEEIAKVRKEMEGLIVSLVLTATKKVLGREIALAPEAVADIVATALKAVAHHKRIVVYINKVDAELLEAKKPEIKALFEHLESLSFVVREDIAPHGCKIETEAGTLDAQIDNQLAALESAFQTLLTAQREKNS